MPRVNFAWDVKGDGDIIVRGGTGIFFTREQGNAQYDIINLAPNSFASTLDAGSLQSAFPGQGYNGYDGLDYQTTGLADPFGALVAPGRHQHDQPERPRLADDVQRQRLGLEAHSPGGNVIEVGVRRDAGAATSSAYMQQNVLAARPALRRLLPRPPAAGRPRRQRLRQLQALPDAVERALPASTSAHRDYDSLQATLSRQSGNFTYLVAYTLLQGAGHGGAPTTRPLDPIGDFETRNYGILPHRPHPHPERLLDVAARRPDQRRARQGPAERLELSGISTWIGGQPRRPVYGGDLGSDQVANAWRGTHDYAGEAPAPGRHRRDLQL